MSVTIRDVKVICCAPEKINLVTVKVETSEPGLYGLGCATFAHRHLAVVTAIEKYLKPYLTGRDVSYIEDIWQSMAGMSYWRNGPVLNNAISGIDMALWDIKGKFYQAPVYELLGGACREKIRVYRWIGGDRPSAVREAALEAHKQGYSAVKMNATEEMHYIDHFSKIEAVCERVAAIRDALGGQMDIAVDFHGRVHKSMAKVLAKELEQFHLMFLEEPVLSQNNEALREIARVTATPVATGERMFSRWEFKQLLQDGCVDVIQPDLSHAGGISECRKIASMAEAYDVAVAPHCPLGPVALGSCIQLDTCTPNVFIQEQSLGIHYNKGGDLLDYISNPEIYRYHQGFIELIREPGLGVQVNEERLAEAEKGCKTWKNPVWRNDDGTIAEW